MRAALGVAACAVVALGLARDVSAGECLDGNYLAVPVTTVGATCDELEAADPGTWSYTKAVRPPQDLCASDLYEGLGAGESLTLSTKAAADEFCEAKGMHVCSLDEVSILRSKDALPATLWAKHQGSKISTLTQQLWSSTPCQTSEGVIGFYTVKLASGELLCRTASGASSMCCSTNKVRAAECKQCPRTSKMAVLEGGRQWCSCDTTSFTPFFSDGAVTVVRCTDKRSLSLTGCAASTFGRLPSRNSCSSTAPWNGGIFSHPNISSCKVYVQYNAAGPDGVDGSFQCPSTTREKFIDFNFAHDYCQNLNARLCTVAELEKQPVNGPGGLLQCASETAAGGIWSRDRCFGASESYFVYNVARKAKTCVAADQVKSSRGLLGFRCCADNSTATRVCDACTGSATSPAGATSWSQCSCPVGQATPDGDCTGPLSAPGSCPADQYNKYSANSCSRLALRPPGKRMLVGGVELAAAESQELEQEQEPPRELDEPPVFTFSVPTRAPTNKPTVPTTRAPTDKPTRQPTLAPTAKPTNQPTAQPTTATPTSAPVKIPPGRNWEYVAGGKTCAAIASGEGACLGNSASYTAAKSLCETMGARMCTAREVRAGALSRFTGGACGSNIWVRTSEPCCQTFDGFTSCSNSQGHVGISLFGNKETCVSDSTPYKSACCADEDISGDGCGACPKGTVAAGSGKGDAKSRCQCPSGQFFVGEGCVSNAINTNLRCRANQYRGSHKSLATARKQNLNLIESRSRNYGGRNVAATSQPPDVFPDSVPACSTTAALTFTQAKVRCESIGARLCSDSKEIRIGLLPRNDPCERLEKVQMWTSRPCGTDKFWTSLGKAEEDKCVSTSSSNKAALACCFDLSASTCYSCPKGSTFPAGGEGGLESCSCANGYLPGPTSNDVDKFCA
jgi:hypothetical protein